MGNLKNVIYLSNSDYATLVNTGTVTIDGTTLTYDEDNLYITPDASDVGMQNPMTTAGDIIVGGTSGAPTRLAKGTDGQALVINNGNVTWQTVGTGDGTVKSVQVQAASPVVSSTSTAQSVTLNTTISLADAYGDTKNPYGSKTKNYVLAAPSTATGTPSFRALVASDIPALNYQTNTSTYAGGTAVTLNNSSKASSTASFYAPTSGGASNTILIGKGTTAAPEWSSSTTWSGSAGFLKVNASGVTSVDTSTYENTTNKTLTVANTSTDSEYPSAKAVYDALENKDSHYEFSTANGITATLALVGDDVEKALRSPIPVYFAGENLGEGTIFRRDAISYSPNWNYYYILFPDSAKISQGGTQFWVNGAYFTNTDVSITASSTFTFSGWSTPNSAVIVDEKINALDVSDITANLGADKTITALSETNGLISASASQIAIKSDQTTKATTNVTIATNDILPVFDNSDSNKLKGSIAFDTTNTSDFLRKDGTWAAAGSTIYYGTADFTVANLPSDVTLSNNKTPNNIMEDLLAGKQVILHITQTGDPAVEYHFSNVGFALSVWEDPTYHAATFYSNDESGSTAPRWVIKILPPGAVGATVDQMKLYQTEFITGSGTSGYIAKFNGTHSVTIGPQLGSSTTTFLRNDGQWATPVGTAVTFVDWS